jgi:predicted Zn-dependent protease with MMP-like domain
VADRHEPPEDVLESACRALEAGNPEDALELARQASKRARHSGDEERLADALTLEAAALTELGDAPASLGRLDLALRLDPDHAEARLEQARALFEACRFEEAKAALEALLVRDPEEPYTHYALGLLAERRGDEKAAARHFKRAHELDPEGFELAVTVSPEAFERLVEAALERIPERVRRYLANVVISVEAVPAEADLLAGHPPLSPGILGLFRGASYGEKSSSDPWSHLPSAIVLYQRNLEREARDGPGLVDEIAVTLTHEVGHFLGLDEEELADRGLD